MVKKKKKKEPQKETSTHVQTRPKPNPLFTNYDLSGPSEGGEVSPGTGLFDAMNNGEVASVDEFLGKARKRKHSVARRKALMYIAELIAKGDAGGQET